MKQILSDNSRLLYTVTHCEFRLERWTIKGFIIIFSIVLALFLAMPMGANATLTLPAIPSNSNLAKRFELSTELIFRVKVGETYLPGGALIAYINGEIRGAQTASVKFPPTGINVYKVLVFNNKAIDDTIRFKYYDVFTDKVYDIREAIAFVPNQVPDYANPVILNAFCQPIDKVTGLMPENGKENLNATLDLFWQPSPNTTSYSLFLWEDGVSVPTTPYSSNISGTTTRLYNLKYGQLYRWKIASKNDCSSVESTVQTFKIRQLPDLIVTDIKVPDNTESGSKFTISFKVKNAGDGNTAGGQWNDAVYISNDQTFSNDDMLLANNLKISQLEKDSSYAQSITVSLPNEYSGDYYFFVKTDYANSVVELHEDNNLVKAPNLTHVILKSLPDILVKDILADKTDINPGDSVTISWKIENIGGVDAVGGWVERISLIPVSGPKLTIDPNFEYRLPLLAGTVLNRSGKIKLPDVLRFSGEASIEVELIPFPELQEHAANKANNKALSVSKVKTGNALSLAMQTTSVLENSPNPVRCIITRSGDYITDLTISLAASVSGQVTIPTTVVIPANQSSFVFNLNAINNIVLDGARNVGITATAATYIKSEKTITILDDEVPTLVARLSKSTATEGETIILTVTRDLVTDQPLTVSLSTNKSLQWTFSSSVIIPANAASNDVSVIITDDNIPELTIDAVIYASSAGVTTGQVTASLVDNDIPQVSLELLADTVSESAGVYATWGLIKRVKGDDIITVNLSSSLSNALFFPATITLPKGALEQKFNIGVVDNSDVDGYRKVTITGSLFISSCNCGTSAENGGIVSADLVIADNDGPSLSITVNPISLPEGKQNAGILTITRNTPTDKALDVTISHNDTSEVNIQTAATILAGQKSVQVPIDSKNDYIEDGNQMVSVQASAESFSSGYGYVFVTDQNKPDLEIKNIAINNDTVATNDVIEISGSAFNSGFSNAASGVKINFYCSKDKTIDASDKLLGEYVFPAPIAQGTSANFTKTVDVPNETGDFFILTKINPGEQITELVYFNNESEAKAITINPEYTVTAITDKDLYLPNNLITIHGIAQNSKKEAVPNVDIDLYILISGTRRELKAKTNSAGEYTVDFVPISNESGHFEIGGCYPKQNLSVVQDAFDIPGLRLESTSNIIWEMKFGQILTGKIAVRNTSGAPLSQLVIKSDKLPFGCELKFDTIKVLAGNQTKEFNFTLKATELTSGKDYEKINFQVKSDEEITTNFPAFYYCQALQAQLKADPVSINTTMTKGKSRVYELFIYNNGAGETGAITINLPNINWMTLVSQATIPNLASQDTAKLILNLSPTSDIPLNTPISGNIAINCVNGNGILVPYRIEAVSEETGGLKIDVIDEYTYFTVDKPHVKNAHVVVRHPFSGKIMADGFTDENGIFAVDNLPEGGYRMTVEADKHEGFQTTLTIDPGRVNEQSVFLSFQAITYTWEVVPTEIQDNYEVQLVMKYETNVPVPVVIVEMPDTMPQLFNDETYPFLVTMTNKGLITAKDVLITFPQNDPEYEFVTSFNKMDLLAQQAIQVPVVMKRRASLKSSGLAKSPPFPGNCTDYAFTVYGWECGKDHQWHQTTNGITFSGRVCIGSGSGGPGWGGYGPGYGGGDPSRGGTGPTHYDPNNNIPSVEAPTIGCDKCLIDIAQAILGCVKLHPYVALAVSVAGCAYSAMDFDITFMDVFNCLIGFTPAKYARDGYKCALGIVNAVKTCYEDPPFFMKSASSRSFRSPLISKMPPILKQSVHDLEAFLYGNNAANSIISEFMGSVDWDSKENFNDFVDQLEPFTSKVIMIQPADLSLIQQNMAGTDFTPNEISAFTQRWNSTLEAHEKKIIRPTAEYPNIVDYNVLLKYKQRIDSVQNYTISRGFTDVGDMYIKSMESIEEQINSGRNSVCASVTINITQKVVMTREAFEGTLTIYNGNKATAMQEIKLNLEIKDENGVLSNDLFQIDTKALDIITGIDGTGTLGPDEKGSATVLFIPEKGAAPEVPKSYSFGGSFSYLDPFTGVTVTKPLFPVTLDVNPSPDLYLHYFMQRDILGDDALTVPIEPIVPAEFAVMIQNDGFGTAKNVRIESAQPKIVENEKGLAINFKLIGSNLNGQPRQLGLIDIDFGNIQPKKSTIGQWWFTSDLLGHFVSYETKLTHFDSRGNPDLSLISGVALHELIKSIRVYQGVEDGINDFLVNEVQDSKELPDIIYLSNGGTLDVYPASSSSIIGSIASGNHEVELQVTPKQIGWNYIKFSDPGNGIYKIVSVTRDDGQVILLDNVWQTHVTLPDGKEPVYENMMHFIDVFAANGTQKYTIRFTAIDQNPPEIVRFENVPATAVITPLTSVNVVFNKPIDPVTFTFEDMTLRVQGGADVMDVSVIVTQIDQVTFNVDLTSKSTQNGYYVLTVQASEISDLTGTKGLAGKQATWTQFISIPAISEFIGLPDNKIGAPFDFMMLRFNLPIDKSTLLPARFTWMKDGTPVSGSIVITEMDTDGKLFQLSGLKAFMSPDGKYSLTVDLPNIKSLDGNNGILNQSVEWEIDQTPPKVSKITPSSDGGYDTQHKTLFTVSFDEPVKGIGPGSLELWKDGQKQPLSQLNYAKKSDSEYMVSEFRLLTYYEGTYQLRIKMKDITDMAGNSSSDTVKYDWTVFRTKPKAVTNLHITPDMGYSNSDDITATRNLVASMTVNEPDARIQIYHTDQVNTVLLADTSGVKTGELLLPVNFGYSGNLTLQARCIDKYTNDITTEIPVFIDESALACVWKNSPQSVANSQPTALQIEFSDKLLDDTKLKEYLKFERDGQSLETQNLTISKSTDKLYVLSGMDQSGSADGTYRLSIDLSKLQKYNSGKQGVAASKTEWHLLKVNNEPVANAGPNQSAQEGTLVTLDGSLSSDADGNALTYKWSAPAEIILSSTTVAKPVFTAPDVKGNTNFAITLVVNDGLADSQADLVVVTVQNVNKAPVANAGSDIFVNKGITVSLDGSASTDPDGNPLTYKWTASDGITLSSSTVAKPTFTAPVVTINTSYTFTLVVNDGMVDSPADQVVVTVQNVNKTPVSNAGSDQIVNKGAAVTLDGSGSTDPDGNPLIYKWSAPNGITLSSASASKPTFVAPDVTANTNYTFKLVVNDGLIDSPADEVVITVNQVNIVPVARAGADQSVNEGTTVALDGSASSDADGNPLTYKWSAPSGIILSSTTDAKPKFAAPEVTINTSYTLTLVVNDGLVDSPADPVVITIRNVNKVPLANAGSDQSVNELSTVTLDGLASSDADGNALTYKWTAPSGIVLSSTSAVKPTFTAPEVTVNTNYTITLVVNDGLVDSPADQVVINVRQVNKAPKANSGPDQSVNELSTVTLDGSASTDAEGSPLTFKWTAPSGITLSSTSVAKPTFLTPEVTINTSYTLTLVVNDGIVDSPVDQVVITVQNVNKTPVANAGFDQTVNKGATVSLDGSASTDPDGTPLTYKWTAPAGITLSSATVGKPTFTAPAVTVNTSYTLTLVVNDGTIDSPADQVVIAVQHVNKTPVSNAGSDQVVNIGTTVTLDGFSSSDPDGNPLTYQWTAPDGIILSSAIASNPVFVAPDVTGKTVYTFILVVNDGLVDSSPDQVLITVNQVNKAPVSNAGPDQSVNEGTFVSLDGSVSSDPDGNQLTYKWTVPAGITLSSSTVSRPTFIAPEVTVNTSYTLTLSVKDGLVDSPADQVVITVRQVNKAPVANAGTDRSVNEGAMVTLDGTLSADPDGNPLTYNWMAPSGISLSSTSVAKPTFNAPEVTVNTSFTFTLVVNDGLVNSVADQVTITVQNVNKIPVANAGPDISVNKGVLVYLDGSASNDPDGNLLTYKWTAPAGITLSSTNVQKPTFTTPDVFVNTSYTFALVVNDGIADSPVDQVVITVQTVNRTPVANAGFDQSVNRGAVVSLDGTASADPDGNPLTYKWTAPAGITLSSVAASKPTFTAPNITLNTSYTFTLVVNDGLIDSPADQVVITVRLQNRNPVANAGPDQAVNEASAVTLDGSASTDPDGNPLTYKWTTPSGITLSSSTAAKPTFIAPEVMVNTSYTLTLVVNDGLVDSPPDQVVITIRNVNKVPVANAGPNQTVNELSAVTLDGSASTDPDGNPLTYKWTAPVGITLSSTTIAKPTFTAPEVTVNTSYILVLVVNDGLVDSPADQVVITVNQVNKAPMANAGPDQTVNELSTVNLTGLASADPDRNPLTYKWTAPAGITLSSTTAANPSFTAPEVSINTSYTLTLVVNDGLVNSSADQVVITVRQVNKAPLANAGPDQSVNELSTVTLNGLASSDPDENPLTYKWTAPAGITLSSTTAANPSFTAPEVSINTSYTLTLVVNDGLVNSSADQVVITVMNVDHPPYVKNAIQDVAVENGAVDQLINLTTVFADDDVTDVLNYSVTSNTNDQVVDAQIANSVLTLSFSKVNTGTADVVITASSNGREVQSKFKVEVKLPTGINDVVDNEAIQVYPNPTSGKVQIKFSSTPKADTWITVIDIYGKIILKLKAEGRDENLNLSGNSPGLYFIKIDQKIPKTFKLILK